LLRQFDVPPDDSSRSLVLDETERYLGHLASVAITTVVDALAQPAAILNVMKDRYRFSGGPRGGADRAAASVRHRCARTADGAGGAVGQRPSEGSGATYAVRADGCAGYVDAAALRGGMGRGVRHDARAGAGRGAAVHAVLCHVKVSNALKVGLRMPAAAFCLSKKSS
jgi:hypothetical protein